VFRRTGLLRLSTRRCVYGRSRWSKCTVMPSGVLLFLYSSVEASITLNTDVLSTHTVWSRNGS